MLAKSYSGAVVGIDAVVITVEVNISAGLGVYLSGLPDSAVKESEQRIRSAYENNGFRMSGRKVVVNLAPADIRKEGSAFDLPIAIGILAASGQLDPSKLNEYVMVGELSLDGSLASIRGALPIALKAREEGFRGIILPDCNADEAAVVNGMDVIGARNLKEVAGFLSGETAIEPKRVDLEALFDETSRSYGEDFSDVKGQEHIKRALEIAVSGGHNILMIGAIGSGKTMLSRRLPAIMPPMTVEEALETTKIHSVAGKLGSGVGLMTRRPFRAPHHLTSQVALVGGGTNPMPGEISLSHNGILFLDEMPEFGRSMLEVLRQPMEDKRITVSRAKYSVTYPANFMLVASMNPCPCGYHGHPTKECQCSKSSIFKYMNRISGPLMDRIDMHIEVNPVTIGQISDTAPSESSASIAARVVRTRRRQHKRFEGIEGVYTNSMMSARQLQELCPVGEACRAMLTRAMEHLSLSARAYSKIIKVARTIADMEESEDIELRHIAEAIRYRSLDREKY